MRDDWALVSLRGRHNKCCLCQTVGRAQYGTVHAEGIEEGVHGRFGHRLGTDNDAVHVREICILGMASGKFQGKVRDSGIGGLFAGRHAPDPAIRVLDEIARGHHLEVEAQDGDKYGQDDAHIVVHRQPRNDAGRHLQLQGLENLRHVGDNRAIGELHAGRGTGGTGGVLQERSILCGSLHGSPGGSQRIRQDIKGNDARALALSGKVRAHGRRRYAVSHHDGRVTVTKYGLEVVRVPRFVGVIQRNRHHARIKSTQEAEDVFRRITSQDGHAGTGLCHLLQARRHHLDAVIDLCAGKLPAGFFLTVDPLAHDHAVWVGFRLEELLCQLGQGELGC